MSLSRRSRLHEAAAGVTLLLGMVTLVWPAMKKGGLVPTAHAGTEAPASAVVPGDAVVTHGGSSDPSLVAGSGRGLALRPPPAHAPRAWDARTGTIFAGDRATPDALPFELEAAITARAREEVVRNVGYANGYLATSGYPNGDIPEDRGACTDVVVRSLRAAKMDLQLLVHEDILAAPAWYDLRVVDTNIDHRRISTMHAYLARNALKLTTDVNDQDAFRPGDIVFFAWTRCSPAGAPVPCKLDHVGIVSDRVGPRGLRLVLENGGPRAAENDSLDRGTLVAHFRALSRS